MRSVLFMCMFVCSLVLPRHAAARSWLDPQVEAEIKGDALVTGGISAAGRYRLLAGGAPEVGLGELTAGPKFGVDGLWFSPQIGAAGRGDVTSFLLTLQAGAWLFSERIRLSAEEAAFFASGQCRGRFGADYRIPVGGDVRGQDPASAGPLAVILLGIEAEHAGKLVGTGPHLGLEVWFFRFGLHPMFGWQDGRQGLQMRMAASIDVAKLVAAMP